MKRRVPFSLSVFAGALSLAVAGAAFAQAKHQLRWGHYLADGPFVQLEKDFVSKIEKRTNGQVKINITFAEGLGKTTELLMLTAKGAIDMTATAPGYNPDQLHYWRAFQTPLLFQTSKQAMDVLQAVVKEFPVYRQEMDRAGVVWLFQQPLGEYYLSGPSPDCNSVAKLKGKKIRSFGADIPKGFSAIGAVPVTVAPTAIYEALQHGTLDYSFINAGNIQQYKLVEVGKHHCGPVMAITGHNVTMSKRTWGKLSPDIQKAFVEQSAETMKDYLAWVGDFETKAAANIKGAGGTFTPFPAEELKKWKAAAPDFLAAWEKNTAEATKDAATPKKVAARWRELLSQSK
jgi:TRAP-type transport system periplasmic protein